MNKAAIDAAREIIDDGEKAEDPAWFLDNCNLLLGGWKEALDEVERLRAIVKLIGPSGSDGPAVFDGTDTIRPTPDPLTSSGTTSVPDSGLVTMFQQKRRDRTSAEGSATDSNGAFDHDTSAGDPATSTTYTRPLRPSEPSTGRVPVLWFDSKGCGPDHFYLEVFPFKELRDGDELVAPPSLGLRLRAGDLVILGRGMIDGGFNLGREQVAAFHQQLGAWLASNPDKG